MLQDTLDIQVNSHKHSLFIMNLYLFSFKLKAEECTGFSGSRLGPER
jgi:hypothetical protein